MCKTPTGLCTDEALEGVFLLGTLVLCLLISTVRGGISPSQTQTDLPPSFRHQCDLSVNSALGRERNEEATSKTSTTANAPKSWPDPALQLLAVLFRPLNQPQQLLSLTHLSAISANQILKVIDPSIVDYGPSVSAAKDEEVPADPNVIAADPNTPAAEDGEVPPDPIISAADPNMPAGEEADVASDPNVVTTDFNGPGAEPKTALPKPDVPVGEPDASNLGSEETSAGDPGAVPAEPNVPAAEDEEVQSDPNSLAADPNAPGIENIEIAPDPTIAAADPNMPAVDDTEVASDPNVVTTDPNAQEAEPDTAVPKRDALVSEPDASSFESEETSVPDPSAVPADPNVPAAEDEEVRSDPNIPVADPNTPDVEDTAVASDPNVVTTDPNAQDAKPDTAVPKPDALVSEPAASSFASEETNVPDPNAVAADLNVPAVDEEGIPSDPNGLPADPNAPAIEDKVVGSNPKVAAADSDAQDAKPQTAPPKPDVPVSQSDASSSESDETSVSDPNVRAADSDAPAVDEEEGPSDPNIMAGSPGMPVAEDKEGASDPNVLAIDPNMSAAGPDMSTSEPNTYLVERFLESGPTEEDTSGRMTELVGFVVTGRRVTQRLAIDDLDSIVTSDGRRRLPLLRVLQAFAVKIDDQGAFISFVPDGGGPVTIDFDKKEIQIEGAARPLDYLEATSEITLKPDIYISPEDLAEILDMKLEWDNALYEYRVQLDRSLSIWKIEVPSLVGIDTELLAADLPEKLPAADRSEDPLHLVELTWPSSYTWRSPPDRKDSHVATLSSPRETFWGSFQNGQYKTQISHPGLRWENDGEGLGWRGDDSYVAKVDHLEWIFRRPSSEVAIGDSAFGLGELVFPGSEMTGIRFNGLNGFSRYELKRDRSSLGLNQVFGKPYIAEGYAPLGATVELLVNDKVVQTQDVFPEEHLPPGIGRYRFDEIQLSSGIVNEITVVITEPNGNEIRVEESVKGAPPLLPEGRNAYLGVLGSTRDLAVDDTRDIEFGNFYGHIVGGRFLYGLSDRLTIGGMLGLQRDLYKRYVAGSTSQSDSRSYPESSQHAGGMFSYLPFDKLFISGDFGASHGQGQDSYSDLAGRMRAEYLPTERLSFNADLLNLGSDYFDGENRDVSDRRGGELGVSWRYAKNWTLKGGLGLLRDNLDGDLDDTLLVDYQNIGLQTTVLPRTSLELNLDRLSSNLSVGAGTLGEVRARTSPFQGLDIFGQISVGDELELGEHDDFFSGLKLKNAPWFAGPSQLWGVRKSLTNNSAVTLAYSDADFRSVIRLIHDLNIQLKQQPLRVRVEALHNVSTKNDEEKFGFQTSTTYLLDRAGDNRLRVTGGYVNGEYRIGADLATRNLYARHSGRFTNVNEQRIRPAYGAVHGKVFLDYDGDVILDPDEPGVPDIKVFVGARRAAVTNKDGYYILPSIRDSPARVYLDIDTVPAIYTVTHGTQLANIVRDSLTEVNLSLAPIVSVSGRIVITEPDGRTIPISGARVYLTDVESSRLVADSFTAEDGSYYIGNLKSGDYILQVDAETVSPQYILAEQKRTVKVVPTRETFQEIRQPDFTASVVKE